MFATILLSLVVIIILIVIKKLKLWGSSESSGPPEVAGSLPFIGHVLYLGRKPEEVFMIWGRTYGKLFSVNLGNVKTVIIDDPVVLKEMFNDMAFNGRPSNDWYTHISHEGHGITFWEGKNWESNRKFTHTQLRAFGIRKDYMEKLILNEVKEIVEIFEDYANKPLLIKDIFHRPVVNSLWVLTTGTRYGKEETSPDRIISDLINSVNKLMSTGLLFAPKLRYLAPSLLGWNSYLSASEAFTKFQENIINEHKATYVEGHHRDLIDSYISEINKTTDTTSPFYKETGYRNLLVTLMDLFAAATASTTHSLNWAVLYLTIHQDVQEKLYKEIEKVIGTSRTPELSDRPKMPYTEAIICEVLRLGSLAPLGAMNKALYDKEYNGFLIRKGTTVIGNIFSIHRNPKYWGDPENFRPERFLSPNGEKLRNPPHFVAFQVGRRECLGQNFALDSLFLFITAIFQNFHITQYSKEYPLDLESVPGIARGPKPFYVRAEIRS